MKPFASDSRPALILLCAALVSSGCGFSSGKSGRERMEQKQQDFVSLVDAAGGSAELKPFAMPGMPGLVQEGWTVLLSEAEVTDELIDATCAVADKKFVLRLDLSKSTVTDEQLAKLDENRVLRGTVMLDLSDTPITDAGLDQVEHVHALSEVNLTGTQVTQEAVNRLKQRQSASPDTPPPFRKGPKVKL